MKNYLVKFKNKKTGEIKKEVKVNYNEKIVEKTPNLLVLVASEELIKKGEHLPKRKDTVVSWREL